MLSESSSESTVVTTEDKTKSHIKITNEREFLEQLNSLGTVNPYYRFDNTLLRMLDAAEEKFKTLVKKEILDQQNALINEKLFNAEDHLQNVILCSGQVIRSIKHSHEKQEVLHKFQQKEHFNNMQDAIEKKSNEALGKFDEIKEHIATLHDIDDPMTLYEKLDEQKADMIAFFKIKDDIIDKYKEHVQMISDQVTMESEKYWVDIQCFIERINAQIDIIRVAYKEQLHMLGSAIETELQSVSHKTQEDFQKYLKEFYIQEGGLIDGQRQGCTRLSEAIKKLESEQRAITQSWSRRLNNESANLVHEMQKRKNQILLNSEKLDNNDAVLKLKIEDCGLDIIHRKHCLSVLVTTNTSIKQRIRSNEKEAEIKINHLTDKVKKYHTALTQLKRAFSRNKENDERKFFQVWNANYNECSVLLERALNIDKRIHEEYLLQPWVAPPKIESLFPAPKQKKTYASKPPKKFGKCSPKTAKGNSVPNENETRLIRNILRQISDRFGSLIESKLLRILEPYAENKKLLMRIENIFNALNILDMKNIERLLPYFEPYIICPNCTEHMPLETLKNFYKLDKTQTKIEPAKKTKGSKETCDNHYLTIEPAFILSALNQFTTDYAKKHKHLIDMDEDKDDLVHKLDDEMILNFWNQFNDAMPDEKLKSWKVLEHVLSSYSRALRKRVKLYEECEALKKRNAELKYLLQNLPDIENCKS